MQKRHTILVVDDEADVVKSVQDLLRREYRVLGATSAKEGVEIMRREEVHVVMTDQRMPLMTGVEFLRQVRGEHPDAVRLLFTGYADMRAVIDAINKGNVYRYVTKPWDPDELTAIIREACERYDLIVARQELTAELQRKNAELAQSNAILVEANALKQAFIQVASHELRTPLAILLGLVSLAEDPLQKMQMPETLRRIRLAGERLNHLVEQLVVMLQTQRFDQVTIRSSTNMPSLLRQAADDVRLFALRRGQVLSVDIDGAVTWLNVDAAKIRDAVNHLLLNAIKFTPDGGTVQLNAKPQGSGLRIEVADSGIGMQTEMLSRLFQPFFTGHDVRLHSSGEFEFKRQGLGLGLSIARAFVEMHGGTISATSQPGKGSVFTIILPEQ